MNENGKNNDGGFREFMCLTPVGELTPTQLSNLTTAFSNVMIRSLEEDGIYGDREKTRQGFSNLLMHLVVSYPDKCCKDILSMIIEEGRKVPVGVEHLNKCLRKSKGFGQ